MILTVSASAEKLHSQAAGQNSVVRLDVRNAPIRDILGQIEKSTSYVFFYSDATSPKLNARSSITMQGGTISAALDAILSGTDLTYEIKGNQVSIIQKRPGRTVSGRVTDESGNPLTGVSVVLKSNPSTGMPTDAQGNFSFDIPNGNQVLVFSFIGMETREVRVSAGTARYDVQLRSVAVEVDEIKVVVETGIFQRDKVSFTGSTSTVTGEELRRVGNQNIVQSLKTMDPSFVVLDNLAMGSDPNTMASIELRGQGAATINAVTDVFMTDPNQPLFVLNGVEVSLQRIIGLDINRIQSVTLLKDAGSTAIYGSRGANGVVVVETMKPVPGELKVYYTGDYSAQAPDLTVFNMMNAREKLEFERLSGKYTSRISGNEAYADYQLELDKLYSQRLNDVLRGVDTYWLSEPVRTGLTHSHSVRVSTGFEALLLDAGAKYKNEQGVMKGSDRETWEGNMAVTYRTDRVVVSNDLTVSGFDGNDSPYGRFSNWVNANPYFEKYNPQGGIDKHLETTWTGNSPIVHNIPNPLYNARLNNVSNNNQVDIVNSLQAHYIVNENLRFKGGLDLTRMHNRHTSFKPAEHTDFDATPNNMRGNYYHRDMKSTSYRGYLDGSFARIVDELHSFTVNARVQARESVDDYVGVAAEGFSFSSKPTPNQALNYATESRPDYYYNKRREVNLIGTFNYNYARRYLLDFSYSLDGASTFGSNRLYKSFWSTGIGWNIDREAFAADWNWLDILKLRASTGISGNQNIGQISSSAIYNYYVGQNNFGESYYLSERGNPDLPWQVSRDLGFGMDFRADKGRYSLTVDFFRKKTDPNIIYVPQVPSTGVSTYPRDMGWLEIKGMEFIVAYSPIYDIENRTILTLRITGAHNKGKYGGLTSLLDALNKEQIESATMRQFRNGYSPTSIWAVRSAGIDPATGEEIFIKKNGDFNYSYDSDDMVVVGDTKPDLMGTVQLSFRYGNFFASAALRYSIGSDIYNSALYNKVENITLSALERNQDKRALYDRWQNPGDKAAFRSIGIVDDRSPITSRFVQKNNYLTGESFSLGYELINKPWVKRSLGMQTLSFSLFFNDIFRLETSKTERGYEYPFARLISLSIKTSF